VRHLAVRPSSGFYSKFSPAYPLRVAATRNHRFIMVGSSELTDETDIHDAGYDVPWESLNPCALPADPVGRNGIWIGSGQRWPNDREPDGNSSV
jgi:hypothetical protein